MKKLVFLTVLALVLTSAASWGLVVIDEQFEGYNLDYLSGQPDQVDPYNRSWTGLVTPYSYECNELPDAASPAWTWEGSGTSSTSSVSSGILTISDGGNEDTLSYYLDIPELVATDGVTVEMRVRCTSYSPSGSTSGRGLIIHNGSQLANFTLTPNSIAVRNTASTITASNTYTWADPAEFHTIRVTMKRWNSVTRVLIYVNGNPNPVVGAAMNDEGTSQKRIIIGSTSGSVIADYEYDYVRVWAGVAGGASHASPLPEVPIGDYVVHNDGGSKVATWMTSGFGTAEHSIQKLFPLQYKSGTCDAFFSVRINGTCKVGGTPEVPAANGGNTAYFRMRDFGGAETVRFYIAPSVDAAGNNTSQLNILRSGVIQNVVSNAVPGQWYHVWLEINLDTKKYSTYVREDINDPWDLKYANADFHFVNTGLYQIELTMYDKQYEFGNVGVSFDNIYVEGPDNLVPSFLEPAADCGRSAQYRFWTANPVFKLADVGSLNPFDQYEVKVFTKAQVDAANFDVYTTDTSKYVWSGTFASSAVATYAGPTLTQWSGGFPVADNEIYYAFARIHYTSPTPAAWGNFSGGVDFVVRSTTPTGPLTTPVVTSPTLTPPNNYVTSSTPPSVEWTVSQGEWDMSNIVITDISVTPNAEFYNSNWTTGLSPVNVSTLTSSLLQNGHTYSLTVQVRKGCAPAEEQYISPSTYGTFTCLTGPPNPPVISSPSGSHQGLTPAVTFNPETTDAHNLLHAKIFTQAVAQGGGFNPDTSTAVWDSTVVTSQAFGVNCNTALTAGSTYYVYAKIGNPLGWSGWSTPSIFMIRRDAEVQDIRHMDEVGLLTARTAPPDDMFSAGLPDSVLVKTNCTMSEPECTPGVLRITDLSDVGGLLQKHNCIVDFNKGNTVLAAVRTWVASGSDLGEGWKAGNIIVTDADMHCGASIKVRPDHVAICVNGTDWTSSDTFTSSNEFRVIRITSKAERYNDPTSVRWNVYVDEGSTPAIPDVVGAITESGFGPVGTWVTSQITIGSGSYGLQGITDFDWTAVNGSGAYPPAADASPVAWNKADPHYVPAGSISPRSWKLTNAHASISDAIKNGETGWATITPSNGVINHVGNTAYYVQDAEANANSLKIDAVGSASNKGKKLNSVTGFLSSDGVVKFVRPTTTVNIGTSQLAYSPLATNIKVLGGSPCVTQLANLGGPFVDNRGKLVRVWGQLPAAPIVVPGEGYGSLVFFVDDLSHPNWVLDGRNGELPGLRILLDLDYYEPNAIWDRDAETGIGQGHAVQVTGVSTTEDYLVGGAIKSVRKIADPVIEIIAAP